LDEENRDENGRTEVKTKLREKITQFRKQRKTRIIRNKNLTVIKRSNKMVQALMLPKVMNINPRSVYNKIEEFKTFIEEENIDIVCMSESWERENKPMTEALDLEDYEIISSLHQRKNKGGRPAIFVKKAKYQINDLMEHVKIPWGVEAVWTVLTPKNVTNTSKIKKIIIGSIYSKPNSKSKTKLLDHISEVYHTMGTKFQEGLEWVIAGDTNDLKLEKILALSPKLKQVVQKPTRKDKMLDPIFTTMVHYYKMPQVRPPLDNDPDKNGVPSDHRIVIMEPLNVINNTSDRTIKEVTVRPLPESGIYTFRKWMKEHNWRDVKEATTANEKADCLKNELFAKLNEYLPTKVRKITIEDQPFFTEKLKTMKRKKNKLYNKERKSEKWKKLEETYQTELNRTKKGFYKKKVEDLKTKNKGQWFSELKKLSKYDQKKEHVIVEEINELTDQEQAEKIADKFSQTRQEYDKLKKEDVKIPLFEASEVPVINVTNVKNVIMSMNNKPGQSHEEVPPKLMKRLAPELAIPLTDIINTCIKRGEWPDEWKKEITTPIPKEFPPRNISELRPIAGLQIFDKVSEKVIAEMVISDMKSNMDPAQFANQKGESIQHYLILLIHKILSTLDMKEKRKTFAIIATLVDWKEAFSRQCPKIVIESFIKNGVRASLIPLLINYYQDRKLIVKWHGERSSERDLNGGGPQGGIFGIWGYLSNSNDNAETINPEDKFKFVDDLTYLETINLLSIGLSSYNVKHHVPSDVPTSNIFLHREHLKSQESLTAINNWTKKNKMILNQKKTKSMIFNFSKQYPFTTRLELNGENIEVIKKTRLLGTIVTEDLKWEENTALLVKQGNARMQLLKKVASFTKNKKDLKEIYILFVRSILEKTSVVWHSSLTKENEQDLERVQKSALRVILGKNYVDYKHAMKTLKIQTLKKRREELCLSFAKKCTVHKKFTKMFPKRRHIRNSRKSEKYKVIHARTERFQRSAIIYMQNLLNKNETEENK
jgi:exonuclease III